MRRAPLVSFVLFATMAVPSPVLAEWVVQFSSGSAHNLPARLKITQEGEEDLSLTARYDTRAFSTQAYYFDIRVGRWQNRAAWELETHHHKLFLSNRPEEVQRFGISHGYNLNTVNRAWLVGDFFIFRLGAGFVVTHPETQIRGRKKEDDGGLYGFFLSGVTAQAGLEKRFEIGSGFSFSFETKFTASYAEIPVAGGEAVVPNFALHGLVGVGYRL